MRDIAQRLWIASPPPAVMGTLMLLWPKPPWPWIILEWLLAATFIATSLVARRSHA